MDLRFMKTPPISLVGEYRGLYRHACPNCGEAEEDYRLFLGLPCFRCLPIVEPKRMNIEEIARKLKGRGKLAGYKELYELHKKLKDIEELFRKAVGSRMWSAQRTWAKRVLRNKSFAIVAPTGVGKTLFGLFTSLYIALREKGKSYVIVPTTPLVIQAEKKLNELKDKLGANVRILTIHSRIPRKERGERLAKLQAGDFDILITTSRFLQQNFTYIKNNRFKFIFVDDVDAILKSSKSIDLVLQLMGFKQEVLDKALEVIKMKRDLMVYVARGAKEEVDKLTKKIEEYEKELNKYKKKIKSVLIVSTATGRPKGIRVKLFRELLGFEVGARSEFLRNVVDAFYMPKKGESLEDAICSIVKKLGNGGLIFIPIDKGVEYAKEIAGIVTERTGLIAKPFYSKEVKALEEFIEGKVNILVGVATYYGILVRGLDLPERVRYAVFAGIPRHKFTTQFEEPHPIRIFRTLTILREVVSEEEKRNIDILIGRLRRHLQRLPTLALQKLTEMLIQGEEPKTRVEKDFTEALKLVRQLLSRSDIKERLKKLEEINIVEENGKTYLLIPDVMTYIQASGRTSRLYAGGITKGLSVVVVDDPKLFNGLVKRMKWVIEEVTWKSLEEINLDEVLKEIDEDRENVRLVLSGKITAEVKDLVKTVLMVVESPNKARTIASFFGKPNVKNINDVLKVYEVTTGNTILLITASGGHVYDLVVDEGFHGVRLPDPVVKKFLPVYTSLKRCLVCGHQFTEEKGECPHCGSKLIKDSRKVIEALREVSLEVDEVLIGTDPDTEGEKIGWDVAVLLAPYTKNIKRIEFHEVTRRAILNALNNPRNFDFKLIEAQIVRRIEDRWIGFTLSPILWFRFWPEYCRTYLLGKVSKEKCEPGANRYLSAGRVQTPVLGFIVKRYDEFKKSIKKFYRIKTDVLEVTFTEDELPVKDEKELESMNLKINVVEEKEEEIKPLPPFTTDMLLAEASARLRLGAQETMKIAQELFEMGFITYHRTDSTRISDAGINVAREYLREMYGDKYKEYFAPRTWGTGGAHEGIRPTKPIDAERLRELIIEGIIQPVRRLTKMHYALYDLIFRRFIASQMKPAKIKKQIVEIEIAGAKKVLEIPYEVIEEGFLVIYKPIEILRPLKSGEYPVKEVQSTKRATVPLYTQGDVIKVMKEKGIGRPSTYAKIIQTILQRGYVRESKKQKKLMPTQLGREVYSFLTRNYGPLVSEERTRLLEELMDKIERGELDYQKVLHELYEEVKPIEEEVERYRRKYGG